MDIFGEEAEGGTNPFGFRWTLIGAKNGGLLGQERLSIVLNCVSTKNPNTGH